MDVTLLYFDDCPNWQTTEADLTRLRGEYGLDLQRRRIAGAEEAELIEFRGSPTVLFDGLDPFADPHALVGLSCRLYRGPHGLVGSPSEGMLRQALDVVREGRAITEPDGGSE